jgi:hypothetical protein
MVDPIHKAEKLVMAGFATLFAASLFALSIGAFISALFFTWFAIKTAWQYFI